MKWPIFALAIAFILFSSCTSYRIISDYEKNVNYSSFKTYQVMNHKDGFPAGADPENRQQVIQAIQFEMNTLGYSESKQPDLLVAWFVKVKDVETVDFYMNYYDEWDVHREMQIVEYQEGTLVVDLIDVKNNRVIWHAKTSDRVYAGMPNLDEKIKNVVEAMFDKYEKDIATIENVAVR